MAKKTIYSIDDILANVRPTPMKPSDLTNKDKIDQITEKFQDIMNILGLDLTNESLQDSPRRVAKMFVTELFAGLDPNNFPAITVIENEMAYDQMIVVRDVGVMSTCEHHFVTISGKATIAYIPDKKVIGLSKINRITEYFSKRPQVQERLTKQIADCLQYVLETDHVAVHIDARHYCVVSRGVEDINSTTATSDLRGAFKKRAETRAEFYQHVHTK